MSGPPVVQIVWEHEAWPPTAVGSGPPVLVRGTVLATEKIEVRHGKKLKGFLRNAKTDDVLATYLRVDVLVSPASRAVELHAALGAHARVAGGPAGAVSLWCVRTTSGDVGVKKDDEVELRTVNGGCVVVDRVVVTKAAPAVKRVGAEMAHHQPVRITSAFEDAILAAKDAGPACAQDDGDDEDDDWSD